MTIKEQTHPPELTPTALSDTIATSVNFVLSTASSPLAFITASALVQTNAALLDNPPPLGTVPSTSTSMPTETKSWPFFSCSNFDAPLMPALK